MDEQLKSNLTSRYHWLRLVFMLLYAVVVYVALMGAWVLAAAQFLWNLITGSDNDQLRRFSHSLSVFMFDTLQFLTYNTERKPFPFADWPDLPAKREEVAEVEIVEPAPQETAEEGIVEETRDVVEDVEHAEVDENDTKGAAKGV